MPAEGQTATGPNGERAVYSNGQWVVQSSPQQMPADPAFQYEGRKASAQTVKAEADANVATRTTDAQIRLANAQAAAAQAKANQAISENNSGGGLSPAQKKVDEEFASMYNEMQSAGGIADIRKQVDQLRDAVRILKESDTITGPVMGRLPEFIQQAVNPDAINVREQVEEVVQRNLRLVLGAQFTAQEGERLISRAYNPRLQESYNADRINRLIGQMDGALDSREDSIKYYEANGTLKGWTAPTAKPNSPAPSYAPDEKQWSPGDAQIQTAQGESYSTPRDLAFTKEMQNAYNRGGSTKELMAVANKYDRPVDLQMMAGWKEAIDYRDGRGKYEGQRGGFAQIDAPRSGRRGLVEEALGSFAASPVGAAGIAAGNAAAFGGLDEIAGGINSVASGTSYTDERDYYDFAKQASAEENPGASLAGEIAAGFGMGGAAAKFAPSLAAKAVGSTKATLGSGAALGALTGALEVNDNRLGGAVGGSVAGGAGGLFGAKVAAPAIERLMRTNGAQAVSGAVRSGVNRLRPGAVPASANVPKFNAGEGILPDDGAMSGAINNLRDASRLGVPYSLADADPKLRMLAGSVSRKSPLARNLAEGTFEPRGRGQSDRLINTIDTSLAPVTDIDKRGAELMRAGSDAASPYYQKAYAKNALDDPDISAMLQSPSGKDALGKAYRIAGDEGRDPAAMGFILDDASGAVSINNAGRYSAEQYQPDNVQTSQFRGANGQTVSKKGPVDLVGFLRMNGGLRDSGGELGHMGLTNKPRGGMDFVGQEARFGPLLNERGMNFDDAAEAAWEAGYFPNSTQRPSVNEFLDAMRDTQDGVRRSWLPEDLPTVADAEARYFQNHKITEGRSESGGFVTDNSTPAGPRPFAPAEAYGAESPMPTYETLHMVKRGFDDVVEGNRDALGKLNLQGSPTLQATNNLRGRFNDRLKALNPDYAAGNAEFAKYAKRRDALDQGFRTLPKGNVPVRQFDEALGRARAYDDDFTQTEDRLVPEMQRGFATNMADQADKMRFGANPFESVYGSSQQQQKVGQLFPEGAADFDRVYNLERDMAKTQYETLGGSPTASRSAADDQFDGPGMMAADAAVDLVATGGLNPRSWAQAASRLGKDNFRTGFSQKKADAIAPVLFDTNPTQTLGHIEELMARRARLAARKQAFQKRGGLFGAGAGGFSPIFLSE